MIPCLQLPGPRISCVSCFIVIVSCLVCVAQRCTSLVMLPLICLCCVHICFHFHTHPLVFILFLSAYLPCQRICYVPISDLSSSCLMTALFMFRFSVISSLDFFLVRVYVLDFCLCFVPVPSA